MADDKILQHSHYAEEPVPRLEEAQLSYPQWLTKMHQLHRGEDPPEVPVNITTSVDAFVNAGRWLWECIACNNATVCEVGQPSICVECATQGWVNVVFPSNREDVETELLKQPGHRAHAPIRQWRPGWEISVLEDRTARAQAAVDAGVPFPTSLSIGATRVWSVGEILTAANKNTYERTVLEDLAGRNGPVEYEGAIVIDSLTTTERDAITLTGTGGLGASGNGLVIYNSTKAVFERYENGTWVSYNDLSAMTIASAARGDIFFRGGTAIQRLGAGTARQIFRTGGTGADPLWNDLIGTRIASTTTRGSVIYEDANGRIARLAPPTAAGAILETGGSNANPIWGSKSATLTRFNTAGTHTFTPPSGSRFSLADVSGGGGGGGGGAGGRVASLAGGNGGDGGARVQSSVIYHSLYGSITVVVGGRGAGGAGGSGAAGTAGAAGGASTFGIGANPLPTALRVTAAAGTGGAGGAFNNATAAAGAVGTNGGYAAAGRGGGGGGSGTVALTIVGFAGGAGGTASGTAAAGGTGAAVNGTGGAGAANTDGQGGGGGGGGGGQILSVGTTTGGSGGSAGAPGAGGGGGASSLTTANGNGGNGQQGAAGEVRIWSW